MGPLISAGKQKQEQTEKALCLPLHLRLTACAAFMLDFAELKLSLYQHCPVPLIRMTSPCAKMFKAWMLYFKSTHINTKSSQLCSHSFLCDHGGTSQLAFLLFVFIITGPNEYFSESYKGTTCK